MNGVSIALGVGAGITGCGIVVLAFVCCPLSAAAGSTAPSKASAKPAAAAAAKPQSEDTSYLETIRSVLNFDKLPTDVVMGTFDKYSDADGNVTLPVFHGCIQQLLRRQGASTEVRWQLSSRWCVRGCRGCRGCRWSLWVLVSTSLLIAAACGCGVMQTLAKAASISKRLFNVFDRDGNGLVDKNELKIGMSLLSPGSQEDKIKAAFALYGALVAVVCLLMAIVMKVTLRRCAVLPVLARTLLCSGFVFQVPVV